MALHCFLLMVYHGVTDNVAVMERLCCGCPTLSVIAFTQSTAYTPSYHSNDILQLNLYKLCNGKGGDGSGQEYHDTTGSGWNRQGAFFNPACVRILCLFLMDFGRMQGGGVC